MYFSGNRYAEILIVLHSYYPCQCRVGRIRVITKLPNTQQSSKRKGKLISQQTDKFSQQPENWEHRNGPDLVHTFPKKWWVESDFTAPNLPLPLRLKGSSCHYYNNIFSHTIIVVNAVLYENPSFIIISAEWFN